MESKRVAAAFAAVVATLLLPPPFGGAAAAAPNCTRSCGNISVPYPFGIEPGCYHATWFNLTCDLSFRPPKLFLGDGTVQVLEISVPNGTVRINSSRLLYTVGAGASAASGPWGRGLPIGGPFFLSESRSSVALVGCGAQVQLRGGDDESLIASCAAVCPLDGDGQIVAESSGACAGVGCCQASIVLGYDSYNIHVNKLNASVYAKAAVYLVDQRISSSYADEVVAGSDYGYFPEALPATLDWVINHTGCPSVYRDEVASECLSNNSRCVEAGNNVSNRGRRCACDIGYQGNPYIPDGCQGILYMQSRSLCV